MGTSNRGPVYGIFSAVIAYASTMKKLDAVFCTVALLAELPFGIGRRGWICTHRHTVFHAFVSLQASKMVAQIGFSPTLIPPSFRRRLLKVGLPSSENFPEKPPSYFDWLTSPSTPTVSPDYQLLLPTSCRFGRPYLIVV